MAGLKPRPSRTPVLFNEQPTQPGGWGDGTWLKFRPSKAPERFKKLLNQFR
jgi:hypothetical protein